MLSEFFSLNDKAVFVCVAVCAVASSLPFIWPYRLAIIVFNDE
jgi:hypothetical protein